MRPEERDPAYLWDMLDRARLVREFLVDIKFEEYIRDRMLQLAVERAVEIIGEAARRVSDSYKKMHPEIPWAGIIAQRNVLAHEYDNVKHERLWLVATRRIPELIALLERLDLPACPPDPEPDD